MQRLRDLLLFDRIASLFEDPVSFQSPFHNTWQYGNNSWCDPSLPRKSTIQTPFPSRPAIPSVPPHEPKQGKTWLLDTVVFLPQLIPTRQPLKLKGEYRRRQLFDNFVSLYVEVFARFCNPFRISHTDFLR